VSAARGVLIAPIWLFLTACAGTVTPYWDYHPPVTPQSILCGEPLPPKCQHQHLSFAELPSRTPAAGSLENREPDTESGEWPVDSASLQARLTLYSNSGDQTPETTFGLERVARGFYGDRMLNRQLAEQQLAKRLWHHGDDGGAVDLTHLLVRDGHSFSREWFTLLVHRCPSAKMLHTLTFLEEGSLLPHFDNTPRLDVALTVLNLLKARGLVELGEYDEARVLFSRYSSRLLDLPSFVPQCTAWLEGRGEETTPVPEWRVCNCEIEPPKWRQGCGCPPEVGLSESDWPRSNAPALVPTRVEEPDGANQVGDSSGEER
jgi:hypothetical protein